MWLMKADVSDLLGFPPEVDVFVWDIVLLLASVRRLLLETVKDLETVCITNWVWEVITCLITLYLL